MSPQDTHIPALGNYDAPQSPTTSISTPSDIAVPTPSDLASFLTEVAPNVPLPPHIKLPPGVPFPPLPPPPPSKTTSERGHETENISSSEGERDRQSGGGYYDRNLVDVASRNYGDDHNQHVSLSSSMASIDKTKSTANTSTGRRIGIEEYALSRKRRSANAYRHDYEIHAPPNRRKRSTSGDVEDIVNDNDKIYHKTSYGEPVVGDHGEGYHNYQDNRYSSDDHYGGASVRNEDNFNRYRQQKHQLRNMQANAGVGVESPAVPSLMDVPPTQSPPKKDETCAGMSRLLSSEQQQQQYSNIIDPRKLPHDDHRSRNENFNLHHNAKQKQHFDDSSTQLLSGDPRPFPNSEPLPPNRNFNYNERLPHFDGPHPRQPHNFNNNNNNQRPLNAPQQMQTQRPPYPNDGAPRPPFHHFNNSPCLSAVGFQHGFKNHHNHGERNMTPSEFDSNVAPHDENSYNHHQDHHQQHDHVNHFNQQHGGIRPHYNTNQQFRRPPFHDSRRGRGGRGGGRPPRFNHQARNRGGYRGRGGRWN